MSKKEPTSDALEIMYRRFYEGNPERIAQLQEAIVNDDIARKIRELREEAGFSREKISRISRNNGIGHLPSRRR